MLRAIIKNKKLFYGLVIVFILVLITIFVDLIAPYQYDEYYTGPKLQKPSMSHPFGVDHVGRDVLSRVLYGTRTTFLVVVSVAIMSSLLGIIFGSISSYYSNSIIDNVIMRLTDTIFSIPWVFVGVVIALIINSGIIAVIVSLTIVYSPQMIRIVRSTVLEIKELDYIRAAKVSGENDFSIILRYIIPNSFGPIIVQTMLIMSYSILVEAALSFVGYGIKPPMPSWGILLQDASRYLWSAPFLVIFPGLSIIIAVLGFNYLGDGLRDILDPKYRRTFTG